MRTLGLDYGSKTVGVAVTDPLGLTAQGVEIIRRQKENHLRKTYQRIKELCEQYDVEKIVLGNSKKNWSVVFLYLFFLSMNVLQR